MDGEEIEVYSEDFVRRGRGREERVLARTRQSQGRAQIRGLPYIRRRTVGESVGLGLKCGKLGVSVYVCASERRRKRRNKMAFIVPVHSSFAGPGRYFFIA